MDGLHVRVDETDWRPLQTEVFENTTGDGATILMISLSW